MNFSIGDFRFGHPVGWLLGAATVLAPLLYLALAWRSVRRGSVLGVWLTAGAYLAVFVLLVAGTALASFGPSMLGRALAIPLLLLGPALLSCAAVLHVGMGAQGSKRGVGTVVLAAVIGYLTLPAGGILAMVVAYVLAPGH